MRPRHILSILIALATVCGGRSLAQAASPGAVADVITPYVDNQTFLTGRLDVEHLPFVELQKRLITFLHETTNDPAFCKQVEAAAQQVAGLRKAFIKAGGREIYLFVSMADFPQPPFLVVTSSSPENLSSLAKMIGQLTASARPKLEVRKVADNRLLIGTKVTLDRVEALKTEPRAEVAAAWQAASNAPIQLALTPSADHHRVLEETLPQFPRPWNTVTGQAISDGIQWAMLSVSATPKLKAELLFESKNDAAARHLRELTASSLAGLADLPVLQKVVPNARELFALIQPHVTGKQVRITLTEDAKTLESVMRPLLAAVTAGQLKAKRMQATNNLKQIAIAMHNYHDVNKHLPAAASYDAAGKPLLSWRVHILPYIDQTALYDQFKLDEPWDSEHNKKLAQVVPKTYLNPNLHLNPSMTTYVVPVGEGTVFGGKEGLKFRDIRDGASNTLMVVAATPENAVIWTKPDDLPVTEADSKKGLFNAHRHQFLGVLCDGSVHVFADSIAAKTLWNLMGANDGEVVDWQSIK